MTDTKLVLHHLYKSQEEQPLKHAMVYDKEMSQYVKNKKDIMNLNCSASSTVKSFRKVCYSYKREYFWRMKMYQNQILRVQE